MVFVQELFAPKVKPLALLELSCLFSESLHIFDVFIIVEAFFLKLQSQVVKYFNFLDLFKLFGINLILKLVFEPEKLLALKVNFSCLNHSLLLILHF
jgi:hypothetical protein